MTVKIAHRIQVSAEMVKDAADFSVLMREALDATIWSLGHGRNCAGQVRERRCCRRGRWQRDVQRMTCWQHTGGPFVVPALKDVA